MTNLLAGLTNLIFVAFHTNYGSSYTSPTYNEQCYYVMAQWHSKELGTVELFDHRFCVRTERHGPIEAQSIVAAAVPLDPIDTNNLAYPFLTTRAWRFANTNRGLGTIALCCCETNVQPLFRTSR
jgi:hypothetical protein